MIRRFTILLALALISGLAFPTIAQPQGSVVRFTGQLLDVRNGYVYFTTGAAFKLAPTATYDDYDTGKPTTLVPQPKLFARAVLDPATKQVVQLDLTRRRLPMETAYAPDVQSAIATKPTTEPAPEIVGPRVTGRDDPTPDFDLHAPLLGRLRANITVESMPAARWRRLCGRCGRRSTSGSATRSNARRAAGARLS